jgi:hypothetical protein
VLAEVRKLVEQYHMRGG